jgi:hypothetical protein
MCIKVVDTRRTASVLLSYIKFLHDTTEQLREEVTRGLERIEKKLETWPQRAVEQIVKLPLSEYISYDAGLQKLARATGVPPERLKAEIDEWIEQVKSPSTKG